MKDVNESEVRDAVTSLSNTGFINYFGMQRFGTSRIPTHQIGKALIAKKWENAVDLILSAVTGELN